MHIYAFGSICRGDMTVDSDIDVLAIVAGLDERFDPNKFSIYSYNRISELWNSGNAFAWHLHYESRLIFTEDGFDNLAERGPPGPYIRGAQDCARFKSIFENAYESLKTGSVSTVFELSTIFLSIRNLATCYSLAVCKEPNFGRDAAVRLGQLNVSISDKAYHVLRRARVLSTRGIGSYITPVDTRHVLEEFGSLSSWVVTISRAVEQHG